MSTAAVQKYASMAAADLKEGSNLFDNVNAKVTGFKFSKEAPENYTAEGNPIFAWLDLLLDGDAPEDERKVNQSYSLGAQSGDNFEISDDGYGLIPKVDDAAVRKDCKWGTFTTSLETVAGFPTPKLQEGNMACLLGTYGHFKRIADKERNFGDDQRTKPNQKKSKFPPSTLCCVKILALPGEQPKAATTQKSTAPAGSSAPSMPAPAAGGADVETKAMDYLTAVVGEKGSVQRSQITLLVSKAAIKEPDRQDIARLVADEGFLAKLNEAGIIKYDPAGKPQVILKAA